MFRRTWLMAAALCLVGFVATAPAEAGKEQLVIVTAKSGPIDNLSIAELRQVYLGSSLRAKDGTRVLALNRGNRTQERVDFDRSVLRMGPDKVARYWIDRRIRGKSGSPKAVEPAPLIQKVVMRLPGSIAYVKRSQVNSGMKVVTIGGKKPGQAGYPLAQ